MPDTYAQEANLNEKARSNARGICAGYESMGSREMVPNWEESPKKWRGQAAVFSLAAFRGDALTARLQNE